MTEGILGGRTSDLARTKNACEYRRYFTGQGRAHLIEGVPVENDLLTPTIEVEAAAAEGSL